MKTHSSLACLCSLALLLVSPPGVGAANLVVTNLADSGPGSLRAAVLTANANPDADVITFDPALSGQVIQLGSELVLSNQVTIDASGLADGILLTPNTGPSAGNVQRVLRIAQNAVVELDNLAIQGGYGLTGTGLDEGAGILMDQNAALTLNHCTLAYNYSLNDGGALAGPFIDVVTLNDCTIAHNTAVGKGGGIFGVQQIIINNSTIYDNVALDQGGGLVAITLTANNSTFVNNVARSSGALFVLNTLLLTNCTVSGNTAYVSYGGIWNVTSSSSAWVNSIVAGNTAPTNANFDLLPAVVSHSLTNGDPVLAPLGDYGGPTLTMLPMAGSPALDAGDDSVTNSLTTDQRGYPRLSGAHVDIGAVESQVVNGTNAPELKLTFSSSPNADFTVLAATNAALPLADWTMLGHVPQVSSGQYQFTDPDAINYPQRFYQVVSP